MNRKLISFAAAAALCFSFSAAACADNAAQDTPDAEPVLMEDAELLNNVSAVYECENGNIKVTVTARGLESDVVLDVYVSPEGLVEKIEVVSHGETPGIGGVALSDEYLPNYYGLDSADEVDAYAGASVTSKAIAKCVNTAINQYKSINGIEFEAELTLEELIAAELEENLGEDWEQLELEELTETVTAVYKAEKGFAFLTEGKGHAEEPMQLLVFTDNKGVVRHISVIESFETEGIGSKVLAPTNLFFYYGGSNFAMIDIPGTWKIDVVGGATETSLGVMKLVNAAMKEFAAVNAG